MAIKRPAKNRGTSVRKTASSTPVRHVDVMAANRMASGEIYVGWLCKNKSCGLVIAIIGEAPGGKTGTDFNDPSTAIKCPHCGDEDLYRWSARSDHQYTPKGSGT